MTIKTLLFFVFAAALPALAQSAEIRCVDSENTYEINIIGIIDIGDAARFERCTRAMTSKPRAFAYVSISSKGGLVSEAIRIGRELRKRKLSITDLPHGECLSSCIFVFAGATQRSVQGTMGIHRPYFLKPPEMSYDAALKAMLKEAKAYFHEMNIPERLAEDMFSISPEQMRILDREELASYRLNQDDMAASEERSMAKAAAFGLSRPEYERRADLARSNRRLCLLAHESPNSARADITCTREGFEKAGLRLKDADDGK